MGFIKVISSLVNPNAWTEQYVENFQSCVNRTEREHSEFPRCVLLAIAWTDQFKLPFCPVPSHCRMVGFAKLLGSFYSCLDKPYDSEALGLHAVFEAKNDKACAKADKAFDKTMRGGGDVNPNLLNINYVIGEKFGERYKQLTRQIVEDLANRNYSGLEQKFAMRNPTGSRYFITVGNDYTELPVKKLPDSHKSDSQGDLVFLENEMGLRFGVGEEYFKNDIGYQEIKKLFVNEDIYARWKSEF